MCSGNCKLPYAYRSVKTPHLLIVSLSFKHYNGVNYAEADRIIYLKDGKVVSKEESSLY